jgi:hypothetical protein
MLRKMLTLFTRTDTATRRAPRALSPKAENLGDRVLLTTNFFPQFPHPYPLPLPTPIVSPIFVVHPPNIMGKTIWLGDAAGGFDGRVVVTSEDAFGGFTGTYSNGNLVANALNVSGTITAFGGLQFSGNDSFNKALDLGDSETETETVSFSGSFSYSGGGIAVSGQFAATDVRVLFDVNLPPVTISTGWIGGSTFGSSGPAYGSIA